MPTGRRRIQREKVESVRRRGQRRRLSGGRSISSRDRRRRRRQQRLAGSSSKGKKEAFAAFAAGEGSVEGIRYRLFRYYTPQKAGEEEAAEKASGEPLPSLPTPRGALFYSGDPTLAKRAEEELRNLSR